MNKQTRNERADPLAVFDEEPGARVVVKVVL